MSILTNSSANSASRRSWLKKLGGVLAGGFLLGRSQKAAAGQQRVASVQAETPFLSEIMLVAFNFPPKGWALCNGQLLPINQNQALFALLGTTYGGDGRTTFALPDLRGRVVAHVGDGLTLGEWAGTVAHTLTTSEIPPHTHGIKVSTALGTTPLSGTAGPVHHYLADNGGGAPQFGNNVNAALASAASATPPLNVSSATGGSQAHTNMQPYLCLNYIICIQGGEFPSPN